MKKLNKILFSLVLLLLPLVVSAKVIEAGDNVNTEGVYDSTMLIAGNMINNKADIKGIAFIAGNSVKTTGKADYGFYAGNDVTIASEVEGDLFAAGNVVTLTEEAIAPRDVYLAASKIKIDTTVGRNLYAGAEEVDLRGITIKGNANIEADKLLLDENTIIAGTLTYNEDAKVEGLDKANVAKTDKVKREQVNHSKPSRKEKVTSFVIGIATAVITMVIIFALFPKFRIALESTKEGVSTIALTSLAGLAAVICTPVIAIIAMFTGVLLPISLMVLGGYLAMLYLASLVTYFIVGHSLYAKLSDKPNWFVELLIGILIYKLLSFIPIVGGILTFLAFVYGMGKLLAMLKASFGKK